MTLRLCIYPLHVRPYGGAAFVGITHFENRKKGKGWSKNATLLTIAVQFMSFTMSVMELWRFVSL